MKKTFFLVKRLFDLFFSLITTVILSPLFLIIALVILFDDGWPILFVQERVGKNWRIFRIYKFRTMKIKTPKYAIGLGSDYDTKSGSILRRIRLDELPQLFNILSGKISFVGPRPEIYDHAKDYPKKIKKIFTYKPGLTSPASLSYIDEDSILSQEKNKRQAYLMKIVPKKIQIDLDYFQKETFIEDFNILCKTAVIILGKIFEC